MSRPTNHEVLLITEVNPLSPISESFRALRTNTQFTTTSDALRVISVTSCQPNEGKTTTVSNLAVAYAQEGKRTLLIDADLRKPSLHKVFGNSNRKGLSHLLARQHDLQQVIVDTHIEQLSLIPAGPIPPNPAELLGSKAMDELLASAREHFEVILIDTPPVLAVTDAQVVAAKSDGVLLVIRAGTVKKNVALKAKTRLEHVHARILGVVLNGKKKTSSDFSYYEYAATK
jgi:capsular exopolysaccharide synthesis family protein